MVKGYYVYYGYMGWVCSCNRYILFATENEYKEFLGGKEDED